MVQIIMATYHGEKYIKQQIDSILKNSYKDIQLTVYDDSAISTNTTNRLNTEHDSNQMFHIMNELTKKYDQRLQYIINKKNKGCSKNFLEGLQATTADYIMFSDHDDVWHRDKIQVTLDKMQQMEQEYGKETPIAVFTDATVVDSKLDYIHSSFHQSNHLDTNKIDLPHLLMENKLIGCTVMVNKALKEMVKTIPQYERMHDWWLALIAACFGKIGYVEKSTMLYRQHNQNVIGHQEYTSYIKKRMKTLRAQRQVILNNMKQAEEFLSIYGEQLTKDQQITIKRFASLSKENWFYRRFAVLRYGYLKTGLPRNIGVLLVI